MPTKKRVLANDTIKDISFLLIKWGGEVLRLAIGWFYLLSMEGILTSTIPILKIPLWAAVVAMLSISVWFFYKRMGMFWFCFSLFSSAVLNYLILYIYNPLPGVK